MKFALLTLYILSILLILSSIVSVPPAHRSLLEECALTGYRCGAFSSLADPLSLASRRFRNLLERPVNEVGGRLLDSQPLELGRHEAVNLSRRSRWKSDQWLRVGSSHRRPPSPDPGAAARMNQVICGTRTPYFADFLWFPPGFPLIRPSPRPRRARSPGGLDYV
jgi:hypothetical protein